LPTTTTPTGTAIQRALREDGSANGYSIQTALREDDNAIQTVLREDDNANAYSNSSSAYRRRQLQRVQQLKQDDNTNGYGNSLQRVQQLKHDDNTNGYGNWSRYSNSNSANRRRQRLRVQQFKQETNANVHNNSRKTGTSLGTGCLPGQCQFQSASRTPSLVARYVLLEFFFKLMSVNHASPIPQKSRLHLL
jgi:hypothetical protein